MGLLIFTGCLLLVMAPILAAFIVVLRKRGTMIVFMIGSSFFWLVGFLVSAILWWAIPPLRPMFWWSIPFGVLFQEGSRYVFWRVMSKAQAGVVAPAGVKILDHFHGSLAAGLGVALTHALIVYTSVLWDALGPGTLMSSTCPSISLFVYSGVFELCYVLFHIAASVIAFEAFKTGDRISLGIVFGAHLLLSLFTIINISSVCGIALVLCYLTLAATVVWAIKTVRDVMAAYRSTSTVNASALRPVVEPAAGTAL